MAPRITTQYHEPTANAPKGPAIPLAGPLFSFKSSPTPTGVHPEFSRL